MYKQNITLLMVYRVNILQEPLLGQLLEILSQINVSCLGDSSPWVREGTEHREREASPCWRVLTIRLLPFHGLGRPPKEEGRATVGSYWVRVEKGLNWGPSQEASRWRCLLLSPCLLLPWENHSGLVVGRAASPTLAARQQFESARGWAQRTTHRI